MAPAKTQKVAKREEVPDDDLALLMGEHEDAAPPPADDNNRTLLNKFSDFNLRKELLDAVVENGFQAPSDVQCLCIPYALERRDVLCQAKSGKGKTACFVLSILQLLELPAAPDGQPDGLEASAGGADSADGACADEGDVDAAGVAGAAEASAPPQKIQAIVLCNTHELAFQISEEFERFARHIPAVQRGILRAVGGVSINIHIKMLRAGSVSIVIGTVGRVCDLIEKDAMDLSAVKHFVIDEFDDVLKNEDNQTKIARIIAAMPADHQTMLFTATLTDDSRKHLGTLLKEGYIPIEVDNKNLVLNGLVQCFMDAPEDRKLALLTECLTQLRYTQAVIFVNSMSRAATLASYLNTSNFQCDAFFGRKNQKTREALYRSFKEKRVRLLVSTDIFQRGVDFEGLNLVIHFDMPKDSHAYLHRSGRAGRFETSGLVISMVATEDDAAVLREIQDRFVVEIGRVGAVGDIDQAKCFIEH